MIPFSTLLGYWYTWVIFIPLYSILATTDCRIMFTINVWFTILKTESQRMSKILFLKGVLMQDPVMTNIYPGTFCSIQGPVETSQSDMCERYL